MNELAPVVPGFPRGLSGSAWWRRAPARPESGSRHQQSKVSRTSDPGGSPDRVAGRTQSGHAQQTVRDKLEAVPTRKGDRDPRGGRRGLSPPSPADPLTAERDTAGLVRGQPMATTRSGRFGLHRALRSAQVGCLTTASSDNRGRGTAAARPLHLESGSLDLARAFAMRGDAPWLI